MSTILVQSSLHHLTFSAGFREHPIRPMARIPFTRHAVVTSLVVARAAATVLAAPITSSSLVDPASAHLALPAAPVTPSVGQRLSYSMGIVSIGCWMIPGYAQLWQNYQAKSGEGIALGFVSLWLAGDLLNGASSFLPSPHPACRLHALSFGVSVPVLEGLKRRH